MQNVAPILNQQLLPTQVRHLRRASQVAARHGVALYLVGGTLRDVLLGQRTLDLDLAVVGAGPEFASALAEELDGEVVSRSQFGTSKLKMGDAVIDLATARSETYLHPGALPTVAASSIQEDMARRDFSINAMAASLAPDTWGDVFDPFDGQEDLRRRIIRVLHPRSFMDDATRILRAIRYAERLRFQLEPDTERLLGRDLSYLDAIKGDRIRHELERIFREERAASMLKRVQNLGVLSALYPSLNLENPVLTRLHELRVEETAENDLLFMSLLAYSVPADALSGLATRLNLDKVWAGTVRDTGLVKDSFDILRTPDIKPSQMYALLRPFDVISINACALATEEPLVAQRLAIYLTELRHLKTSLKGDDLMGLGVPEGPMVGRMLGELLTARLDGLVTNRTEEVDLLRRRLQEDTY